MSKPKRGRPVIMLPCTFCRKEFTTTQRKKHEPHCPKRKR